MLQRLIHVLETIKPYYSVEKWEEERARQEGVLKWMAKVGACDCMAWKEGALCTAVCIMRRHVAPDGVATGVACVGAGALPAHAGEPGGLP